MTRRKRRPSLKLSKDEKKLMFWHVSGVGEMTRSEFEEWLKLVEPGSRIIPPPYSGSDTPFGDLPDLPPEVEQLALTFMAEALFKTLRESGQLRRLEQKSQEMEKLVASTRVLLREKTTSEMGGSEQISV